MITLILQAHPDYMCLEKVEECKAIRPDRVDYLLYCLLA